MLPPALLEPHCHQRLPTLVVRPRRACRRRLRRAQSCRPLRPAARERAGQGGLPVSMVSSSSRASAGMQHRVLPVLTTWVGPRTDGGRVGGHTVPVTSQSNRRGWRPVLLDRGRARDTRDRGKLHAFDAPGCHGDRRSWRAQTHRGASHQVKNERVTAVASAVHVGASDISGICGGGKLPETGAVGLLSARRDAAVATDDRSIWPACLMRDERRFL